jgi:hypothetical protein
MKLNEMRDEAHRTALEKGWYEGGDKSPLERHMLMVSEIAEATECVRNGEPPIHFPEHPANGIYELKNWPNETPPELSGAKPEGEAIELADVILRIGDYFGRKGWDLEQAVKIKLEFNKTRPHRHGGKTA